MSGWSNKREARKNARKIRAPPGVCSKLAARSMKLQLTRAVGCSLHTSNNNIFIFIHIRFGSIRNDIIRDYQF